jgi:hypothetical protein
MISGAVFLLDIRAMMALRFCGVKTSITVEA